MAQPSQYQTPVNIGTADQFACVRSALQTANFDEETVLRTLKMEDMSDIGSIDLRTVDFSETDAQFELFVNLFLFLRSMPRKELECLVAPDTLKAFFSLGLVGSGGSANDDCYSRVLLYPVMGFLMASDRYTNHDGSPFVAPPDIVFPAIYSGTLRFLQLLPLSPAENALDLCAGPGIGAFVLSRFAKRAVSSDITVRATQFAVFNRYLNDLTNVEVVCGDLYEPVMGQTFDRIVAHPPYVPSATDITIWRDGGATGERLVRRIISEVPSYLRPGGFFCIVSLGLDTKEGRFEERVRKWLKESGDAFDIIFASTDDRKTPREVLRNLAEREGGIGPEERQALEVTFAEAGIINMPKGALVMRRHEPTDRREGWTLRTSLSTVTNGADFERTFIEHPRFQDDNFVKTLVHSHPRLAPRLEVTATHVVYEGALVPAQFIFETDKPFNISVQMDGWTVPLIAQFDGKSTPLQIYEQARADGEMPEDFGLDDFNTLVARMIERGFLTLPEVN